MNSGVVNSITLTYSYIRVCRPLKQSISKEINCVEHVPPNYLVFYATANKNRTKNWCKMVKIGMFPGEKYSPGKPTLSLLTFTDNRCLF